MPLVRHSQAADPRWLTQLCSRHPQAPEVNGRSVLSLLVDRAGSAPTEWSDQLVNKHLDGPARLALFQANKPCQLYVLESAIRADILLPVYGGQDESLWKQRLVSLNSVMSPAMSKP